MYALCYGGDYTCQAARIEGEAYGVFATSDNSISGYTSIGVYGESSNPEGQGVAGRSFGSDGRGGVFTATGLSAVGMQATSVYGDGAYGQTSGSFYASGMIAGVIGANLMANGGGSQTNAGVYGYCGSCAGVIGETASYIGVRGISQGGANSYAGYFTATQGVALYGKSTSSKAVYGTSTSSTGVYGDSSSGTGIYGHSVSSFGAYGFSGSGYGLSGGSTSGFGIRAASTSNYGLYTTSDTGPAAAYVKITNGVVGLRAVNSTPAVAGHYSIIGEGNAYIVGTLHATGGVTLVAPTSQGDRQMYGGAATQNLLTDAGTATLVNGRAVVKIDPLFAQTVDLAGGYRVFLTPNSFDSAGLGVGNKSSTGFEVRELNKGSGNFSFDWKIEAVRKGYEKQHMDVAPSVPAAPNIDVPDLKPLP